MATDRYVLLNESGTYTVSGKLPYTVDQVSSNAEFRGILWHQGLRRDLSLVRLVEDEALRLPRDQVRTLLQQLHGPFPLR